MKPKLSAVKNTITVVTKAKMSARANFTEINSLRLQPSIIFWRLVLYAYSLVIKIMSRIAGRNNKTP